MNESGDRQMPCGCELILFRLGELFCSIDVERAQEINRNLDITPVRHAPPYVRGVLNLRGQLLTVIDLRCKLGLEPIELDARMRIIVVRREEGIVGLLVDQVEDIVEANAADMESPPANLGQVAGTFFRAIYKMDTELAAVLDLEQVLKK